MPPVGLPAGAKLQKLLDFKGLNTQATRYAIDDNEFAWLENLQPIGAGNLRSVPGPGANVYSPDETPVITTQVLYLTQVGSGVFQVPENCIDTEIVCIGAGGAGGDGTFPANNDNPSLIGLYGISGGFGGVIARGGGGSDVFAPGESYAYTIGAGGTSGGNGGDTWVGGSSVATSIVGAKGGYGGTPVINSGLGDSPSTLIAQLSSASVGAEIAAAGGSKAIPAERINTEPPWNDSGLNWAYGSVGGGGAGGGMAGVDAVAWNPSDPTVPYGFGGAGGGAGDTNNANATDVVYVALASVSAGSSSIPSASISLVYSTGAGSIDGLFIFDITTPDAIPLGTTITSSIGGLTLSAEIAGSGVQENDALVVYYSNYSAAAASAIGALPSFNLAAGEPANSGGGSGFYPGVITPDQWSTVAPGGAQATNAATVATTPVGQPGPGGGGGGGGISYGGSGTDASGAGANGGSGNDYGTSDTTFGSGGGGGGAGVTASATATTATSGNGGLYGGGGAAASNGGTASTFGNGAQGGIRVTFTLQTFSGGTITNIVPFNFLVGTTPNAYIFISLSDGSAVVRQVNGTPTTVASWPAKTFTNSPPPTGSQFASNIFLIIDAVNGYFALDNNYVTYYGDANQTTNTSSIAPAITITDAGSGYTSAPTVTISGGSGSGVVLAAVVTDGAVTAVNILNAGSGYLVTDTISVVFSGGGGSGAAANATLFPIGVYGTALSIFEDRAFYLRGNVFQISAPQNPFNFSTSDGGVLVTSYDNLLRSEFTTFQQTSGFIFPIADSSIDVINNIQTNSEAVTTFNYYNIDPQVGSIWRDSATVFGRSIMLANFDGIYSLYGGSATKVSQALDGIWSGISRPASTAIDAPSSASAVINGVKVFVCLVTATDPFGVTRPILFCWDGKKWFAASQGNNSIFKIACLTYLSEPQCWATDGHTVFQCFTTPSGILKTAQTKFWNGEGFVFTKEAQRLAVEAYPFLSDDPALFGFKITLDNPTNSLALTFQIPLNTVTWVNNSNEPIVFVNNSNLPLNWFSTSLDTFLQLWQNAPWSGKLLGLTITSSNYDFVLIETSLMYIETTAY